jgi:drug/metabolite transporter (DMT)-like permease
MTFGAHLVAVLIAVLLTGIGQVLVKQASTAASGALRIFANWRLIVGYAMLFGMTLLIGYALRGLTVREVAALQTLNYPVTIGLSAWWLRENLGRREAVGVALLVIGLLVFASGGGA